MKRKKVRFIYYFAKLLMW